MHLGASRPRGDADHDPRMVRWIVRLLLVRVALRILPARLLPFLTALEVVRLALRFRRRVREERVRDGPDGASG